MLVVLWGSHSSVQKRDSEISVLRMELNQELSLCHTSVWHINRTMHKHIEIDALYLQTSNTG